MTTAIARRGDTIAYVEGDAIPDDPEVEVWLDEALTVGPYRWQSLLARGYWEPIEGDALVAHLPGEHDQRTHSIHIKAADLVAGDREALGKMFEHDLGDGYRSVLGTGDLDIETMSSPNGLVLVSGTILDAEGNEVGSWSRKIRGMDDGTYNVELARLEISKGLQGEGIGTRFHAETLAAAEAAGISRAELTAANIGSYAWARAGFEIDPSRDSGGVYRTILDRHDGVVGWAIGGPDVLYDTYDVNGSIGLPEEMVGRIRSAMDEVGPALDRELEATRAREDGESHMSRSRIREMERLVEEYAELPDKADWGIRRQITDRAMWAIDSEDRRAIFDQMPTMWEISEAGRAEADPDADIWPGKAALLSNVWSGTLNLPTAVTASIAEAVSHFQWVQANEQIDDRFDPEEGEDYNVFNRTMDATADETGEQAVVAAAGPPGDKGDEIKDGAMVALIPSDPESFAEPDGLDPSEMHVTLRYLGKAADLDPAAVEEARDRLNDMLDSVAMFEVGMDWEIAHFGHDELRDQGWVAVVATWPHDDETYNLISLHRQVAEILDEAGLEDASSFADEAWRPHITLGYYETADAEERFPEGSLWDHAPVFDAVALVVGEDWDEIPLDGDMGPQDLVAAGGQQDRCPAGDRSGGQFTGPTASNCESGMTERQAYALWQVLAMGDRSTDSEQYQERLEQLKAVTIGQEHLDELLSRDIDDVGRALIDPNTGLISLGGDAGAEYLDSMINGAVDHWKTGDPWPHDSRGGWLLDELGPEGLDVMERARSHSVFSSMLARQADAHARENGPQATLDILSAVADGDVARLEEIFDTPPDMIALPGVVNWQATAELLVETAPADVEEWAEAIATDDARTFAEVIDEVYDPYEPDMDGGVWSVQNMTNPDRIVEVAEHLTAKHWDDKQRLGIIRSNVASGLINTRGTTRASLSANAEAAVRLAEERFPNTRLNIVHPSMTESEISAVASALAQTPEPIAELVDGHMEKVRMFTGFDSVSTSGRVELLATMDGETSTEMAIAPQAFVSAEGERRTPDWIGIRTDATPEQHLAWTTTHEMGHAVHFAAEDRAARMAGVDPIQRANDFLNTGASLVDSEFELSWDDPPLTFSDYSRADPVEWFAELYAGYHHPELRDEQYVPEVHDPIMERYLVAAAKLTREAVTASGEPDDEREVVITIDDFNWPEKRDSLVAASGEQPRCPEGDPTGGEFTGPRGENCGSGITADQAREGYYAALLDRTDETRAAWIEQLQRVQDVSPDGAQLDKVIAMPIEQLRQLVGDDKTPEIIAAEEILAAKQDPTTRLRELDDKIAAEMASIEATEVDSMGFALIDRDAAARLKALHEERRELVDSIDQSKITIDDTSQKYTKEVYDYLRDTAPRGPDPLVMKASTTAEDRQAIYEAEAQAIFGKSYEEMVAGYEAEGRTRLYGENVVLEQIRRESLIGMPADLFDEIPEGWAVNEGVPAEDGGWLYPETIDLDLLKTDYTGTKAWIALNARSSSMLAGRRNSSNSTIGFLDRVEQMHQLGGVEYLQSADSMLSGGKTSYEAAQAIEQLQHMSNAHASVMPMALKPDVDMVTDRLGQLMTREIDASIERRTLEGPYTLAREAAPVEPSDRGTGLGMGTRSIDSMLIGKVDPQLMEAMRPYENLNLYRPGMKASVVDRLTRRTAELMELDYVPKRDLPFGETADIDIEGAVNSLVGGWAQSSASPTSAALQQWASDHSGNDDGWELFSGRQGHDDSSIFYQNEYAQDIHDVPMGGPRELVDAFGQAVYEETQALLGASGRDVVELHRGTSLDVTDVRRLLPQTHREEIVAAMPEFDSQGRATRDFDQQVEVAVDVSADDLGRQPLTSWSTNYDMADQFARSSSGGWAVRQTVQVPIEAVWSTAMTGPGAFHEDEMVLFDAPGDARLFVTGWLNDENLDRQKNFWLTGSADG